MQQQAMKDKQPRWYELSDDTDVAAAAAAADGKLPELLATLEVTLHTFSGFKTKEGDDESK